MSTIAISKTEQRIQLVAKTPVRTTLQDGLDGISFSPPTLPTRYFCVPFVLDTSSNAVSQTIQSAYEIFKTPDLITSLLPLEDFNQVKLIGTLGTSSVVGTLKAVYKTGGFSSVASDYADLAATGICGFSTNALSSAYLDSGWVDLPEAAKDTVFVTLLIGGGAGTSTTSFPTLALWFR